MNISDVFSPNYVTTSMRKRSPFDPPDAPEMQPEAAPSIPAQPAPPMPIQAQQPDLNRDVLLPRYQQIQSELDSAYNPPKIGTGHAILGALVGGITKNPMLGGLVTGETQRARRIQSLTGQSGVLTNEMNQNRAANTADLNNQNIQSEISGRSDLGSLHRKQMQMLDEPKPVPEAKTAESGGQAYQYNPQSGRYDIPIGSQRTPATPEAEKAISDLLASQGKQDTPTNRDAARKTLATRNRAPSTTGEYHDQQRTDKSYQFHSAALDKMKAPIDAMTTRLGRLNDTLDQNSPQADTLVAPELMTVMAGGQGSGIRINEAEINRVIGGRSNLESLKAAINKWSLEPEGARSITPSQSKQIRALVKVVNDKVLVKQSILDDARQELIGASTPEDHRKIVAEANKKLSAIDRGETPATKTGGIKIVRDANGRITGIE